MPFARAEVLALLPNLSSSFKISQAQEWMGTITADRDTAISGITGRRASVAPLDIRVGANTYHMNMIQNRVMTPLVAQMAVFSAIDSTERSVGPSTYSMRGHIDFDGGSVKLDNVYSGDVSVSAIASLGVATPLSYALNSGFDALRLKGIALEIAPLETRSQMQIADIAAPRQVRPGEDVELTVVLTGENGAETIKKTRYRVPTGTPPGTLYLTVADAPTANLADLQAAAGTPARSPEQVLDLLNRLHSNTGVYVRVWRADNAYTVEGRDLPAPPASVAMILGRALPPRSEPAQPARGDARGDRNPRRSEPGHRVENHSIRGEGMKGELGGWPSFLPLQRPAAAPRLKPGSWAVTRTFCAGGSMGFP